MIRRILALGAIGIAAGFAQNSGVRSSSPKAAPSAGTSTAANTKSSNWTPPKTPWGDPDLQGLWPLNHLIAVPLERPRQYGTKANLSDEEVAKAQAALEARNKRFEGGPIPVADTSSRVMRQTSLIVYPLDGRFPGLTEYGKKLQAEMKSSYRPGQTVFDSVEDFSAWDRCVTRGLPVSMEPRNYNNGIRIMQSPGYVVILLEMAHEARVIPTNGMPPLDSHIEQWMGESRGHWEGNTLVVETTNFNHNTGAGGGYFSDQARTIERFTRTGPQDLSYDITIDDPKTWTRPWTIHMPYKMDKSYVVYEYACHEGNYMMLDALTAARQMDAQGKETKVSNDNFVRPAK